MTCSAEPQTAPEVLSYNWDKVRATKKNQLAPIVVAAYKAWHKADVRVDLTDRTRIAKQPLFHNTHIQSDALFGRATEYNENTRTARQLQYHEAKNYLTEEFSFHTENHIFLGDFNEDYYDCHLNGLTKLLGLHHNYRKVITNPYDNTQKDYIFLNNRLKRDACNCDFTPITSSISDHYPLILDIYPKLNVQL